MILRWDITVRRWNQYGDKVVTTYPASMLGETSGEVLNKARAAFGATYDDFRNFWSHDVLINSVVEESKSGAGGCR